MSVPGKRFPVRYPIVEGNYPGDRTAGAGSESGGQDGSGGVWMDYAGAIRYEEGALEGQV